MDEGRTRTVLWWVVLIGTALSGIGCKDGPTWVMETAPNWIGLLVLAWTWNRWPWTPVLVWMMSVHAAVLAIGGHWTYAEVPFGFQLKAWLGLERNPYDRIGHFMQGVTPALLTHELLLRLTPLRAARAVGWIAVAAALAFSAIYELIEWFAAAMLGQDAEAFLGTQGDVWDTQADMLCALIGATTTILLVFGIQRRQMESRGWLSEGTSPR